MKPLPRPRTVRHALVCAVAAALLVSCGGGGYDDDSALADGACMLDEQKSWLAGHIEDAYFWYASNPNPDPAPFTDVPAYFDALMFTGDATLPRGDIWSYT